MLHQQLLFIVAIQLYHVVSMAGPFAIVHVIGHTHRVQERQSKAECTLLLLVQLLPFPVGANHTTKTFTIKRAP